MASTSPWASLYFVALMTFGNYVLFNLLVAILVEGFQAEVSCHWGLIKRRNRSAKKWTFEVTGMEHSQSITHLSFPFSSSGWASLKQTNKPKPKTSSDNPCKERNKPSGRDFLISILCNRPYPNRVSPLPLRKQELSMSAMPGDTRLTPVITVMSGCQRGFYSCSSKERQEQIVFLWVPNFWIVVFQGDANRSYSDEDQSSSNMEELDQFQDVQEGSGTIAQATSFAYLLLLFSEKSKSRFSRKCTPISKNFLVFI